MRHSRKNCVYHGVAFCYLPLKYELPKIIADLQEGTIGGKGRVASCGLFFLSKVEKSESRKSAVRAPRNLFILHYSLFTRRRGPGFARVVGRVGRRTGLWDE